MTLAWTLTTSKDGKTAQIAPWPNNYHREDPNEKSQKGDVISVTPEGDIQTRPIDAIGAWEECALDGACLIYSGTGNTFVFIP